MRKTSAQIKILVTGGAGYIGSHMVRCLLKNNYQPVVLDNLSNGHRAAVPLTVPFYQGDIGNSALLHKIFKKHKISAVMHFSAYAYVGESVTDPQKYYQNNVANTLFLLKSMLQHQITNFIFSSSCAVYGNPGVKKIKETTPLQPVNPYGFTKLNVEKILADYASAYGLKYMALRYFNAAGADDSGIIGEDHHPETHLIPLVLQNLLGKNKGLKIFGKNYNTPDGTCIRDYIHVNDLAEAHLLALKLLLKKSVSQIFNLGTGHGYSVLEIVKMCEKVVGCRAKLKYVGRRAGDPELLCADAALANKILKWKPRYNLEQIIQTAWRWEQHKKFPKIPWYRKRLSAPLIVYLLSNLGWIGAAIIPFLSFLNKGQKVILTSGFVIGGQVLFYLSVFMFGKNAITSKKKKK